MQEGLLRQHNGDDRDGLLGGGRETLYDMRLYLESYAVRQVSGASPPSRPRVLRTEAERMAVRRRRAMRKRSPPPHGVSPRAVAGLAVHRWADDRWETLAPTVETAWSWPTHGSIRGQWDHTAARHAELLDLLVRGETEAAVKALDEQMQEPVEVLTAQLDRAK